MARSPRAPGAIGSDDYTGFSLILICVGLAILGWTAWKMWHAEISAGALIVAHREMQAIAWVSDRFSQADIGVQRADPAGVEFNDLVRLYRNIGTEFLSDRRAQPRCRPERSDPKPMRSPACRDGRQGARPR